MTQATDQQTILQNSVNTEVMLARMDERMVYLTDEVKSLKAIIEAKKISWWQAWGPIMATVVAIGSIYAKFEAADRELQSVDAASVQQRFDMERRIDRLEKSTED